MGTLPAQKISMRGMDVLRRTALAALLLAFACYDGGDGGGPTQPPRPVPRIAGVWSGIFAGDNSAETTAVFDLTQSGEDISGTVSVGAVAWSLQGDIDSFGNFNWRTQGATCGSFDGFLDLDTDTHMEGRAELDRLFCTDRQRVNGDLFLNLERRR